MTNRVREKSNHFDQVKLMRQLDDKKWNEEADEETQWLKKKINFFAKVRMGSCC